MEFGDKLSGHGDQEPASLKELDSLLRQRHLDLVDSLRHFMDRHDMQMKQVLDALSHPVVEVAGTAEALDEHPQEEQLDNVQVERETQDMKGSFASFGRRGSEESLGEGRSHFRLAKSRTSDAKAFEGLEMGARDAIDLRVKARRLLGHGITELCIAAFTLLSAFVVGFQVEEAAHHATDLEYQPNLTLTLINHALTCCFTCELFLRIYAFGKEFIWSEDWRWNLLDFVIVSASFVELMLDLVAWIDNDVPNGDFYVIKAMRVVRILRLVRVFRVVRFFRSLRVLISSILHTLRSVIWALTLLTLIMYTFAILFTYCYTDFVTNNSDNSPDAETLRRYFGSVPLSMLHLFAAISDGISWINMSSPLLEAGWFWLALFLAYIALATFAVLNVVTGVFCQNAIESASLDQEMVIEAQLKSKKMYTDQVRTLFQIMDEGQQGELSAHAFEEHINEPQVAAYFRALDMDLNHAWKLFTLLDPDSSGTIDLEEFVEGCLKLRGPATRLDMEMVLSVARNTAKRQNMLAGKLENLEKQLHKTLQSKGSGAAGARTRDQVLEEHFHC